MGTVAIWLSCRTAGAAAIFAVAAARGPCLAPALHDNGVRLSRHWICVLVSRRSSRVFIGDRQMLSLKEEAGGKILEIKISGKLSKEDYQRFVPQVEKLIKDHGKIRMLLEMHDFHGWEMGALWEDIKFDVKHFGDIERLALVGDSKWEKGMAAFCKPFTKAKIQYFDESKANEARTWISSDAA
jgi:hypothetical protein